MNKITSSVVSESDQDQIGKAPEPPGAVERWRMLLDEQRASGLPISVFCRQRGIAQSTLFAWRRKLGGVGGVGAATFQAVTVMSETAATSSAATSSSPSPATSRSSRRRADDDDACGASAIELRLAGDRRLLVHRGFDRRLLVDLIQTLEALA